MRAERDHLVKRVFPKLRERLLPYRIHLVDIDLRWGITQEEAENDRVLDLCLQQIDECRPFFVGILGERYGWVPERMPSMERPEYGWVQGLTGKSLTELEILHGVLRNPKMRGHAFFYFRNPGFIEDVPPELRSDYQDLGSAAEKLATLKDEIRQSRFPVMEPYPARWDADGGNIVGLEAFGDGIMVDLWEGIQAEHELPDEPPAYDDDLLAEERDYHDRFIESRTKVYVGRESVQEALVRFVDGDGMAPCLVTGPSGSGKSAALAKFVTVYQDQHPDTFVISHFVGASPRSTSLRKMLDRFCRILRDRFEFTETCEREDREPEVITIEIPLDTNELVTKFREFIERAPDDHQVVFVIDALNQLDETDNAHAMYWLPGELPSTVKVITSCITEGEGERTGEPAMRPPLKGGQGRCSPLQGPQPQAFDPILAAFTHRPHDRIEVQPLTDEERFEIVTEVPSVSAKRLDPRQVQLLVENTATKNPLFLLVALEELRGFGSFEHLNVRIASFPREGDTVAAIFTQVIERLEEEFNTQQVRSILSLLSCSRHGLSEQELLELIEGIGTETSTSDLFPILRQLRAYLQHRGDFLDFFHRSLCKAARTRYLDNDEAARTEHRTLADYFKAQGWTNTHTLSQLPYHQATASMRDELEATLTDLPFLQAKVDALGPQPLIDDYDLTSCQRNDPLGLIQGAIRLSAHVLAGDPAQLRSQLYCRLLGWEDQVIQFLLDQCYRPRASAHARQSPWLRSLAPTLTPTGGSCFRILQGHSRQVTSVAAMPDGRHAVSTSSDLTLKVWDLEYGRDVRTIKVGPGPIAVSPDGRHAVVGSNALSLYDLEAGSHLRTLGGHSRNVSTVAVTLDGCRAVSASVDNTFKVWDLETGQLLRTLEDHTTQFSAVALSHDGRWGVSASWDKNKNTLQVWDLEAGRQVCTLKGHNSRITSVAVTADGR